MGIVFSVMAALGIVLNAPEDEYVREFRQGALEPSELQAQRYGETEGVVLEPEALRVALEPGQPETGWKTAPTLMIGGDFRIVAELEIETLPKPAQEDGAAVGLAIASNNIDQPDLTVLRLTEPDGAAVYRTVDRASAQAAQSTGMVQMAGPGGVIVRQAARGRRAQPPRRTFPAEGDAITFELERTGSIVKVRVQDDASDEPRYLGQTTIGANDLRGVKLFAANRNGAEAIVVRFHKIAIRAERIQGLGTQVRTVFGDRIQGEPIALVDGQLRIGPASSGAATANPNATAAQQAALGQAQAARGATANTAQMIVRPAGAANGARIMARPAEAAQVRDAQADDNDQPEEAAEAAKPEDASNQESIDGNEDKDEDAATEDSESNPQQAEDPSDQGDSNTPKEPELEPKAIVPLEEVEAIRFERASALEARITGQVNVDRTGPAPSAEEAASDGPATIDVNAPPPGTTLPVQPPKAEPKPNGIQDVHIRLSGLRDAPIRQIMVNCATEEGQARWRLDTSNSPDWPLVLHRSGTSPTSDLFLEPPPGDSFEKNYTINLTYQDNQSANVNVQAEVHTDPERAYDPEAPGDLGSIAHVYLIDQSRVQGRFQGIDADGLKLEAAWLDGGTVAVPLDWVAGVRFDTLDPLETAADFEARLSDRGAEDRLLARTRDRELLEIGGVVEETEGDRLRFNYRGASRTVPLAQIAGLVLAAAPEPEQPDGSRATLRLTDGSRLAGRLTAIDKSDWTLEAPWGSTLEIPGAEIARVEVTGGVMTHLSDLEPIAVEEIPFFDRLLSWKRDTNLEGGPIVLDGRTYAKGLAVHSKCALTYDLGGRFESFRAQVGFDEASNGLGRVDCRVLVDGEERFAEPDLRADEPPVALEIPLDGAERLELVVDFGAGQDTGDRILWADARLYERTTSRTVIKVPSNEDLKTDSETDATAQDD